RPQAGNADQIARRFLHHNKRLFGLSNREIRNLRITMNNLDETTGVTYMKYEQVIKGLPVFDSEISLAVTARGEVIIANAGQIIPGAKINPEPALSIEKGIAAAFRHCGITLNLDQIQGGELESETGFAHFVNPLGDDREDILAMRVVVNVHGQAVVAYRVFVNVGSLEWYDTLVDANTGNLIYRFNMWLDARGIVYTNSPGLNETNVRTVQYFAPRFGVSGSDVWLLGIESTGNNVDAYLDRDADNSPDADYTTGMLNGRAYAASGDFTFNFSVSDDPRNYKPAVVTNLFFFNNYMHDWMYSLGFTESARNFQLNNYGRGGLANDYVKAEAQDGSGLNNAKFATPPDGVSGRMQQFLFTLYTASTTDDRDSSVDGDIVLHEYGHGVSHRLIGNGSGLGGPQSSAMGEGWSDYWACSNYDDGVIGEYAFNNPTGCRRAPYCVPAALIHDSYNDLKFSSIHDDGEIWAAALWDLNKTLGKTVADKLILDGMKNTPTSPSMINGRDGIIAADLAVYGNVHNHKCDIWAVFARHGMGYGASGNDDTTHIDSTNMPAGCPQETAFKVTVPFTSEKMTVDGELKESAWEDITTDICKVIYRTTNNTAKFGVLWDNTYLYVGVKVLDTDLRNDSSIPFDDDSVEIVIDGDHNRGTTYDSYDRYFLKGMDHWLDGYNQQGVLHGWATIPGGYSIELAIPWSNLGITPTVGMPIGFSVGYNDDDDGGTRDAQVVWEGTGNNYTDTSALGDIILGEISPLEAYYTLDEGSGGSANDTSGNGNHGAINGATWTAGKIGGALSFDGNDYVQIPGLLGQPQNITLAAWVQLNAKDTSGAEVVSLGDHVAIRLDGAGGNGARGFYYDGTTWRATATGLLYAGMGWHHFVYVVDDANNIQKVYVDGVEKGSTAYTQSVSYAGLGSNTFVGSHGNGSGNYDFNGIIDDVRVYNTALSAQEVLDLYNQSSGLVSHWKFDEGSGTDATDSVDGNNGIINGAAWTTGINGGALSFDGVDDYVDLGNPSNLQPNNFSLSVWFKTTTSGMLLRKRLLGYGLEVLPSGNISFWIYSYTPSPRLRPEKYATTSPDAYTDNTWHHAVGVFCSTEELSLTLYIDGIQVSEDFGGPYFSGYGEGAIAIGRDGDYNGSYFKGLVDDVRVYNKALSAQEVQDLYNNVSALVTTASHGFMGINDGDTYTTVTPPGTATPIQPTTVALRSFKAEVDDGRVILTWETSRGSDSAGFNIYRARRRNGTYTKVNDALIDAKGDAASGGSYSSEDQPGKGTFYYKLEGIDYNRVSTMHGPEKVRVKVRK
ncbi:partial Endo-1,4-beta-xylanase A, partial [Candidatus Brocadiaceae bacterium]